MRLYPLHAFIRFFANHGLLVLKNRPQWRTVKGGSREYVARILADFSGEVRLGTAVTGVRRGIAGVQVTDDPAAKLYPMPLTASTKYDVEVGRIRESLVFGDTGLDFFVCGDQLLKGAALNTVQIAEILI